MSDGQLEQVAKSARSGGTACHWRSVGHTYSYRRWRFVRTTLAVLAGVFSAVAGSALLAGDGVSHTVQIVVGVLGLVGAVVVAVDRGLGPARSEADHRAAAQLWRALSTEYFQLGGHPPDELVDARARLEVLDHQRAEAEKSSEPLEAWAEEKATDGYNEAMERLRRERERQPA